MTELENFLNTLDSVVLQAILGAIKLINENHLPTLASVSICPSVSVSSKYIHS